jgi:metallo-beta-lactamase class B
MAETINWFKDNVLVERREPFMIAPRVYYVGPRSVSCYLFDTGDGLILLDQAFAETVHLVFESIRKLGFDPADIRLLLVSHGHFDHCGGTRLIKEYSGATVIVSREDWRMLEEREDWAIFGYSNWMPFEPDAFYDDAKPINIGRFSLRTKLTPGHTPGTTSFFFDASDVDGKTYKCGMHGGIGLNTLNKEWFERNPDWPKSLLDDYIRNLEELAGLEIDIALPSHPNQIRIFDKVPSISRGRNPFVDRSAWTKLMTDRLALARKNLAEL